MSTPAYQKLMLGQRPSLYYRMHTAAIGANEGDLSPNRYHGNAAGPPPQTTGAILGDTDPALTFGGGSGGLYVAPDGNLPGAVQYKPFVTGSRRSFCFWFKQAVAGSAGCPFGDNASSVALQLDTGSVNGVVTFYPNVGGAPNQVQVAPAGSFTAGQWAHWALLVDDTAMTAQLYLNGRAVQAPASYAPTQFAGAAGVLMVAQFPGQIVNGSIDEFAVFERLLTPAEILAQAKAGVPAVPFLDPVASPPLRVVSINPVSGSTYDLSSVIEDLTYSNVDPGGDEVASFTYKGRSWTAALPELQKGNILRITAGLDVVWQGRIDEADRSAGDVEAVVVTAYGLGIRARDNTMREIFVDRDLSRWNTPGAGRLAALLANGWGQEDPTSSFDLATGKPGLLLSITGAWSTALQISEAVYDAGQGLLASYAWIDFSGGVNVNASDPTWHNLLYGYDTDAGGGQVIWTGEFTSLFTGYQGPGFVAFGSSVPQRYLSLQHYNQRSLAGPIGTEGQNYAAWFYNLAVYGTHGLTRQGSDPGGFTLDQLAGNIIGRVPGLAVRRLDAQSFVIPHFTLLDPTAHEDGVRQAAAFGLVDWGTWGPNSPLDRSLNGYFDLTTEDRATAHWRVRRADTGDLDLQSDTAQLYNRVDVSWQDAAGAAGVETRTAYIQELNGQGMTRTASIDAGLSTQAGAQALGDLFLSLFGGFAPARGSLSFAAPITHYRRGRSSPCYMRADGSNIKVADVLPTTSLFALDQTPDRRATFPLKRVEVSLAGGAAPVARCDVDQASDALAALQAQLSITAQYANASPLVMPKVPAMSAARQRGLEVGAIAAEAGYPGAIQSLGYAPAQAATATTVKLYDATQALHNRHRHRHRR